MDTAVRGAINKGRRMVHSTMRCLALSACVSFAATTAQAQCQVAGLAGSPSDASTSQALELIRDRRMQVAQSCPAGSMPSGTGGCIPVTTTAGTPSATPPAAAPAPKAKAKAAPKSAAAAPAPSGGYGGGGLKDDYVPSLRPMYAVWAEGYGDHERRDDVAPDGQNIRFTSYGFMSGIDHTYLRRSGEGLQLGVLAGYNHTHGKFTGGTDAVDRSQDLDGGSIGLYGTYFYRHFALDLLAKADIFDLDQKGLNAGCPDGTGTGSTNVTNYVIASNIYLRHNIGHGLWLEPSGGIRYVASEFGGGATALGLDDGDALRLQAGLRIGSDWVDREGRLWGVSFLAGLYSDVLVSGFVAPGAGVVVLDTDEGEVRALGQLRAKVTMRDGVSLYGQAEVRGGDDYIGVGGKLGARYSW